MSNRSPSTPSRVAAVTTALALTAGLGVAAVVIPSSAAPVGDPDSLGRRVLGPNLVDNGGFGHGFTDWDVTSGSGDVLGITDGGVWGSRRAAVLHLRAASATLRDLRATAPTSAPGVQYQVSAWVRATGAPVQGAFRLYEWKGDRVASVTGERFTAGSDSWRQVAFLAEPSEARSTLQVSLTAFRSSGVSGLKVDRVRVHPVKGTSPSPSPTPTESPTPSQPAPTTSAPEPQPSPTSSPTEVPADGSTLFGASVDQEGRSWSQALADSNAAYGGMEVVRVFYPGLPSRWPGRAGEVGGPVVVSFKANPSDVLAGRHDTYLAEWFRTAPRDRDIWWSYWHEPEDNVESGDFTAQQWRDAYRRIAGLADAAGNPQLHNTVILMCWTASPKSGRSVSSFFPGADVVEAMGWDCYAHSTSPYANPEDMYGKAFAATRELGLPFGVAETGARLGVDDATGSKRGDWLRSIGSWLLERDAAFACYWDAVATGGDYRLLDEPSKQAWREVTTTYGSHLAR